jgi:hypothetical protein
MDSPIRPPPPPPAVPLAPSSPSSQQLPAVDPSRNESLSPENPTPAPPSPGPITTPPPDRSGDSSPASPPRAPAPPTPPPGPTTPPLPHRFGDSSPAPAPPPAPPGLTSPPPHRSGDSSPASPTRASAPPPPPHQPTSGPSPLLLPEEQTPPPPPAAAPGPSTPPAPAGSGVRPEYEEVESASEAGSMVLALAVTQTEESMPPKASSSEASPAESSCKESAVTIAKLLSGKDPAAAETKLAAEKVAPPSDNGTLAAAAVITGGRGVVGSKRCLLGGVVPEKVRLAELRRAELGFRVSAAVFCLISLSVMAADTTPGWSGDSFRRYNEYRSVSGVLDSRMQSTAQNFDISLWSSLKFKEILLIVIVDGRCGLVNFCNVGMY